MNGPKDYIEVKDRLVLFFEKYPDGSVQGDYELVDVAGDPTYVYTARAYRTPDDQRPGIGHASEAIPGRTPFTRHSELENAATSAIGRALVCLGIAAHKGLASAQDVRNAQAANSSSAEPPAVGRSGRPGGRSAASAPITTEQAVALQLEVDSRSIDDRVLISLICQVMNVEAPELDSTAAAKWADKALARFPAAKYDALIEKVRGISATA